MNILTKVKQLGVTIIDATLSEHVALSDDQKYDERISPNIRALRLSTFIADTLLSMNTPVSDTVTMSLDITDRFCKRKVQFDISSNLIIASQDRGNEREPLTLMRTVTPRSVNTITAHALQELVHDITSKHISLDEAERRYHAIVDEPKKYPTWLTAIGGGLIGGGVSIMFSGSLIMIAITTILGMYTSYGLRTFNRQHIPSFFVQAIAAFIITLLAASISWLGKHGVPIFEDVNPNLIVIGGIVLLVAGLAIVTAVQDAIDEFYVTAAARLLRVFMMTIGIVIGVIAGIYLANRLGMPMAINTESPPLNSLSWQYLGAFIIAGGYALGVQSPKKGILIASIMGGIGWFFYIVISNIFFSPIVASGVAATVIGALASIQSRWWHTPSHMLIMAGVVPLVPGLTLYKGLMQLVGSPAITTVTIDQATLTLLNAMLIAIAIAAGATFGIIMTRPLKQSLLRARNRLSEL